MDYLLSYVACYTKSSLRIVNKLQPVPAMAAVGADIATDFGDGTASNWFVASWVISITIAFMLAGANTDMLGRRWFLIAGQFICTVGHLVVGTAQSNPQVIAGMAISGLGAALCQMAAFALPELLPNKWR
jgi:MFS family permease